MGNTESQAQFRPYNNELYLPVSSSRTNDERAEFSMPYSTHSQIVNKKLLKTPFTAIWRNIAPPSVVPSARTNHFSVFDEERHVAYVGYGIAADSSPLSDVWALDTINYTWRQIPLHGSLVSPRSGSKGQLIGSHLLVFGGFGDGTYYSDLHTIDVHTGLVEMVDTSGDKPPGVTTPITAVYGDNYFIWGGFNGEFQNTLYVLNFNSWVWESHKTDIVGRASIPFVIYNGVVYAYGGSKSGGFITINLETKEVNAQPTSGAEPPSYVMGSGMCLVGRFLVFFGGKSDSKWTLLYACDLSRMWWFVFHVTPDGESTSTADGNVSEQGLFLLPRLYGFGVVYEPSKRELIAYLGAPELRAPHLFCLYVGDALSVLNLRDDLRNMYLSDLGIQEKLGL